MAAGRCGTTLSGEGKGIAPCEQQASHRTPDAGRSQPPPRSHMPSSRRRCRGFRQARHHRARLGRRSRRGTKTASSPRVLAQLSGEVRKRAARGDRHRRDGTYLERLRAQSTATWSKRWDDASRQGEGRATPRLIVDLSSTTDRCPSRTTRCSSSLRSPPCPGSRPRTASSSTCRRPSRTPIVPSFRDRPRG
jgi:hypothetical protein